MPVSKKAIVGVISVLSSFGLGSAAGYFVAKRRLSLYYMRQAEIEIADAKATYERLREEHQEEIRSLAVRELLDKYQGNPTTLNGNTSDTTKKSTRKPRKTTASSTRKNPSVTLGVREEPRNIVHNPSEDAKAAVITIIDDGSNADTLDLSDDELSKRDSRAPYIITIDEFMEGGTGTAQVTFTYYEGDNTLSDEKDSIIDDPTKLIGTDNLKFGHGSRDDNAVYIRNERIALDMEVVRSQGKYSEEVAGLIAKTEE